MKVLVVSFVMIGALIGQQTPTSNIPFATVPPSGVATVNGRVIGNQGNATYSYWVVATLPQGQSTVSPPAVVRNAPNTLSAGNRIELSWTPANGATSYTVIRTTGTGGTFPGSCTSCQVATGVTGVTASDTGGALGSFTYAPIGTATGSMRLNNDGINPVAFVFIPPVSAGGGATIAVTPNTIRGDNAGNGVAVTGNPTDCALVNGTSAPCGTAGALTQTDVCSIATFGAVGNGITNDAAAFNTAQATCKQIQLVANKNYLISTPLTLTSAVNFVGGATMIASNAALTINGSVYAPLSRAFTIVGTGTIALGQGTPYAYPEWFGAIPDSSTDDTLAIQQAYNSKGPFTGGLRFVGGGYKVSSTLNFSTSFVTVEGNSNESTQIQSTATTGNIIDIVGGPSGANCGTGTVSWQVFRNFIVTRFTQATSGDGFNIQNTCWLSFFQVYSNGSINNFHLRGAANTHLTSISAAWNPGVGVTRNGVFLDSGGGIANNGTIIDGHSVSNGGDAGGTGMLVQGDCVADLFVYGWETARLDTALLINSTLVAPASNCNSDIHISKLIADQILTQGVLIENLGAGGTPSVQISDSHFQSSQGHGIVLINSHGVAITNNQFQVHGGAVNGVQLNGAGGNTLTGNVFQLCDICVNHINNASNNTVTGNVFNTDIAAGITTTTFINFAANSFENIAIGNIITGAATNGIVLDSAALANVVYPNAIHPNVNLTNAYVVGVGGKGNVTNGPGFSTPTLGGTCPAAATPLTTGSTNTAGAFVSNTTGLCSGTINFDFTRMGQPPNGWSCSFDLETASLTQFVKQNGGSRTAVLYQGNTTSGDTIHYICQGF